MATNPPVLPDATGGIPPPLTVDPNPPIPTNGLVPPLTSLQRITMIEYMAARWSQPVAQVLATVNKSVPIGGIINQAINPNPINPDGSLVQAANPKAVDPVLISDYIAAVNGGGGGGGPGQINTIINPAITSPFSGILGALTSSATWVRVGEFVFGGILLAIGVSHILGGSFSGGAKAVGKVTPAGRALKEATK